MRSALFVCLLAALCGCGTQNDKVADARRQAHGLAAADLLVLESLQRGAVSPRFAREHLRDSRKNLDEIRKQLKDENSAPARQLDAELEKTDQLLQQLADQPQNTGDASQLQQMENSFREGGR